MIKKNTSSFSVRVKTVFEFARLHAYQELLVLDKFEVTVHFARILSQIILVHVIFLGWGRQFKGKL